MAAKKEEQEQEFFAVLLVEDLEQGENIYSEFSNRDEAEEFYESNKDEDFASVLLVRILKESRAVTTIEKYTFKDEPQ